jgi:hypothetical protein
VTATTSEAVEVVLGRVARLGSLHKVIECVARASQVGTRSPDLDEHHRVLRTELRRLEDRARLDLASLALVADEPTRVKVARQVSSHLGAPNLNLSSLTSFNGSALGYSSDEGLREDLAARYEALTGEVPSFDAWSTSTPDLSGKGSRVLREVSVHLVARASLEVLARALRDYQLIPTDLTSTVLGAHAALMAHAARQEATSVHQAVRSGAYTEASVATLTRMSEELLTTFYAPGTWIHEEVSRQAGLSNW